VDLNQHQGVFDILAQLADPDRQIIGVDGTWGSFTTLLVAHLRQTTSLPILYIRPHIDDADKAGDDLFTFGIKDVDTLPAWEGEEDYADATDEIRTARLGVALNMLSHSMSLVCAPIQALSQPAPKGSAILEGALHLKVDQTIDPEQVAEWLVDNGFETVDRIDLPGQFARRGGIIDIFAPVTVGQGGAGQTALALRIEFFGDTIESMREIDLDTHRSTEAIRQIDVISATAGTGAGDVDLFARLLPKNSLVVFEEPADCQEVATLFVERVEDPSRLFTWPAIFKALTPFKQIHISRFGATQADPIHLQVKSIQQFQHQAVSTWAGHKAALEELIKQAKSGRMIQLYCESAAELSRVREIVQEINKRLPRTLTLIKGFIHQGFSLDSLNTTVISHHELFGQYALRRKQRPLRASAPVDSLVDLIAGDYVVHASYGIGKFLGVKTIEEGESAGEYLSIEYADKAIIQVSVSNITLVQKYIGTSPTHPKLSKVGSKKWQKQKEKVAESVRDLAAELLQVQAARQAVGGFQCKADSNWQNEFEESFPYQETDDQITAIGQIKGDMQQAIAMDRLLCGDVGYGKTELAMRAAFKTVDSGRQVAVLVPTTVLCIQHGRTFAERFADFPISIDILNRFRTAKQVTQVCERAKRGQLDVLIGTHKILSKAVGFKDLGLVIIDEEQRFGVEHKERLKKMRVDVDILTMSATPIPRTLHMSMLGLRDISSLATPPLDRRSVVTQIVPYNNQTIRKAILRELNRNGQVFFLHNRVKSIAKTTWDIRTLIEDTDAKVEFAHGQMSKSELEGTMIKFVRGKIDVLVSTTIIESGLDIPNANTIIIDNADRFGLAELHQLRGRVGRYRHRAYAYMLLPKNRTVTPIASKRLKAIEEYSHLGAGFRIALRDLEIRGAGNILGAEQSGHIQLVGYQMYCEMLAQSVRELKHEYQPGRTRVTLDLGFTTFIPKQYIMADRQRMDVYRRIATCDSTKAMKEMAAELSDVYGEMPTQVEILLDMTRLRIRAGQMGIRSISASGKFLIFSFSKVTDDRTHRLFAKVKGKVIVRDPKTVMVQLSPNYFEPPTLMTVLRNMFSGVPDQS
jgi:transcription-repair coupling factor (superfamily II helicase)